MTFPRFFNAQDLGQSLKEVATDFVVTTHHDVISRWFHSSQDADLFIWLDTEHNVIKQQISFYGQIVEWNAVEGLKTGLVIEDEQKGRVKGSEIVQFDQIPQKTPVDQALAMLKHVTALKEDERKTLALNFSKAEGCRLPPQGAGFWSRFLSALGF